MRRLAVVALIASATSATADQVHLKGGRSITGRVVERTDTRIVLAVGAGRITLPASSVVNVTLGSSALDVYDRKASELRSDDLQGWLDLALWARDQELHTQSRAAMEHVLALDPQNASANAALGNSLLNGRWLPPADAYRARGYVQFEGEWMTPAEREDIVRQRMERRGAEVARAEAEARVREAEARARAAEADARRAEAEARYGSQGELGVPVYPYGVVAAGPFVNPYAPAFDPSCDRPVHRSQRRDRGFDRERRHSPPTVQIAPLPKAVPRDRPSGGTGRAARELR